MGYTIIKGATSGLDGTNKTLLSENSENNKSFLSENNRRESKKVYDTI